MPIMNQANIVVWTMWFVYNNHGLLQQYSQTLL